MNTPKLRMILVPVITPAEKTLNTATTLLPRISSVSHNDRLRIEVTAAELRSRLEQVPLYANVLSFPASVAS